ACSIPSGHLSTRLSSFANSKVPFFLGLILIVVGTGLLKPNISAIVGDLYATNDPRREAGFSLFYMGLNTGARPLDTRHARSGGKRQRGRSAPRADRDTRRARGRRPPRRARDGRRLYH